jgi:hypothetical protein
VIHEVLKIVRETLGNSGVGDADQERSALAVEEGADSFHACPEHIVPALSQLNVPSEGLLELKRGALTSSYQQLKVFCPFDVTNLVKDVLRALRPLVAARAGPQVWVGHELVHQAGRSAHADPVVVAQRGDQPGMVGGEYQIRQRVARGRISSRRPAPVSRVS